MTKDDLADAIPDLAALLTAVKELAPDHVSAELLDYLTGLPHNPVALSVLHASLSLLKHQRPAARSKISV